MGTNDEGQKAPIFRCKMKRKTNRWSPVENARRYFLHSKLKGEFKYTAKGRTIEATPEQIRDASPWAHRAIIELQTRFHYNIQNYIPQILPGIRVQIHQSMPDADHKMIYVVNELSRSFATIQPTKGRWRKPLKVFAYFLVPV